MELRPCPFCSSVNVGMITEPHDGLWSIHCRECWAGGPQRAVRARAKEAWNQQSEFATLRAENERLRAERDRLRAAMKRIRHTSTEIQRVAKEGLIEALAHDVTVIANMAIETEPTPEQGAEATQAEQQGREAK